jgi:hypothetical protein
VNALLVLRCAQDTAEFNRILSVEKPAPGAEPFGTTAVPR